MLDKIEEKRENAIVYLLEHLKGKQVGKKSIQKLVYFLQVFGVDLNYRYKMYHYGPYCSELSRDLNVMNMMGTINIEDASSTDGYSISATNSDTKSDDEIQQFLDSHKQSFHRLLSDFKRCSAKKLELYATIHFVERVLQERAQDSGKDDIVQKVRIIKPKYSTNNIMQAYNYLLNKSIIGQGR